MNVRSRILRLERQITESQGSKMTVIYRDGKQSMIEPGDGIDLVHNCANILRFEGGGGMLADLLNGLLDA